VTVPILHLAPAGDFQRQRDGTGGIYIPADFERDGFIHCTREPAVLLEVANRFYRGVPGPMVVLVIDPERLRAEVRYEAPPGEPGRLFPHVYGPLNLDAVTEARPARRLDDGTFVAV
jgi:uncharacterized protein (DUF952 family)